MRFVDYMLQYTKANGIGDYFVFRPILAALVSLMYNILNSIESIYQASFQMFGFIYSQQVIDWIRPWIGYLWVPLAVAVLVLGINILVNNDDIIKKGVPKKFVQNFCLLLVILLILPIMFIGTDSSESDVWVGDGNGTAGNNGIIGIFTAEDSNGANIFLESLGNPSGTGGTEGNGTIAEDTIADNVYDLEYIFNEYSTSGVGALTDANWSVDSGVYKNKNSYQAEGNNKTKGIWDDIGRNYNDLITEDEINGMTEEDVNDDINALDVSNNNTMFLTKENTEDNISPDYLDPFAAGFDKPDVSESDWALYDENHEISVAQYLFGYSHAKHQYGDGDDDYTYTTTAGMDKGLFDWQPLSNYKYRYYIDWGVLLIQLLFKTIVLIGMSFKIVQIIFELAFSQFVAIFAASTDLTNGQRAKEALRVIFSLVLTLAFSVVLFQFYTLGCEYVNATFSDQNQVWIKTLFNIFLGIACIKGTTILKRVLGIDGGGTGRELGALAGAGFAATKAVGLGVAGAKKVGSWAKGGASAVAGGVGRVSGAVAAHRQHNSIGGQGGISSVRVNPNSRSSAGRASPNAGANGAVNGTAAGKGLSGQNAQDSTKKLGTASAETANGKPDSSAKGGEENTNPNGDAEAAKGKESAINGENAKAQDGKNENTAESMRESDIHGVDAKPDKDNPADGNAKDGNTPDVSQGVETDSEAHAGGNQDSDIHSEDASSSGFTAASDDSFSFNENEAANQGRGDYARDYQSANMEAIRNSVDKYGIEKGLGRAQGNVLDDAMGKMAADPTLSTKDALNQTLNEAGLSKESADLMSSRIAETGVMEQHKGDMANAVSNEAQSLYQNNPGKFNSMGEAYREAAKNVYSGGGADVSTPAAAQAAEQFGDSVLARDNYQSLSRSAEAIRTQHNNMNPNNRMTESESFQRACEDSNLGIVSDNLDRSIYDPKLRTDTNKVITNEVNAVERNTPNINSMFTKRMPSQRFSSALGKSYNRALKTHLRK